MGPKRTDNTNKNRRLSQLTVPLTENQENHHCLGRFAADLEVCCRELSSTSPLLNIPVYNRNHPSSSSQQLGTYSGASVAPSLTGGEEQLSSSVKLPLTGRIPSNNATLIGLETDNRSTSILGHESIKSSSSSYRTFHLVRNSDFYRPKFLADPIGHENDPIDQIKALYMRAWQLDQRFIDILKKVLPLQEQLHTLDFYFVGLNAQTIYGFADVCQTIKNLKTVSLDGNPLAAEHFYILIDKPDLKIVHLSLRFCEIGDTGSERLANALGTMYIQNCKLLTLTLTGNQIGDHGATSLAKALRYNRTLISLNLSSNCITDTGACALAFVLRKISLTYEEITHRRYLLSERYGDASHGNDFRHYAPSPTLSTTSTKSRSARELKRNIDSNKSRKTTSTKSTEKRHRTESTDENRPSSTSKNDPKKGANARSTSTNTRSTVPDPVRTSATTRIKKSSSSVNSAPKKNTSSVKDDEDANEKGRPTLGSAGGKLPIPMAQRIERENPLLEKNENQISNGEISLKGNFVLLNLNLSRNHLSSITVDEFLLSVQYQTTITQFNETIYASLVDFLGLCRLELKDMEDISKNSSAYQSLNALLMQKNPSSRFQQIRDYETKLLFEQQQQQQQQQSVPSALEKTRIGSSFRPTNQRPTARVKDSN